MATTTRYVYTATAPDGTEFTRTSERDYPFAVVVRVPARAAYTASRSRAVLTTVPRAELPEHGVPADAERDEAVQGNYVYYRWTEEIPAFPARWLLSSFNGTRQAAEKARPAYDGTDRKLVVATTRVEKGRRS